MAKKSNRVICLILTILMIVGMVPVANAQYVYNEAKTTEPYYTVDYNVLVGTENQAKLGVYIVDPDWEFKANEAPATVTFNFRGQEYTETYNPERHLFKFSDVYVKAKEQSVVLPICILTEGNYSGNGTLTLSGSIILLGAKAGINPNVPNADPTKEWELNDERYYDGDIGKEDFGGETRLWNPGSIIPDVGYVEGLASSYTEKIIKITQNSGVGTFVIDGLSFLGYGACLDGTIAGTGTWNVYVQNCIFGDCYSYDTETLRFWNRQYNASITKKIYLSNSYVRDNNLNGFYSGHAQTIHVNGLSYQDSDYACFFNVQNLPWQGYDFSCENSHFWNADDHTFSSKVVNAKTPTLFGFNMTSYSYVGAGSESDENKFNIKNNTMYNCHILNEVYAEDKDGNPTEEFLGYDGTSVPLVNIAIGGLNDRFTFEDNMVINNQPMVDDCNAYSPLRMVFVCDKNTNKVTHGFTDGAATNTMLDPNFILGEDQLNINNNTFVGKNNMCSALKYYSGGVLNEANEVKMEGNLYLPTLDATEGQVVTQTQEDYKKYAKQFYDVWVWMNAARTIKSSDLYESDFKCNANGLEKNGTNWTLPLSYDVMSVDLDISCHKNNSVVVYKSNADFEKVEALENYTLDTSERTSYYVVSLISIDGNTCKDYKLTVKRDENPAAKLNDVIADSSIDVKLKESYGDNGHRFEINYDNAAFKFTLDIAAGATAEVKNKAVGNVITPTDGVYSINLWNENQDYEYIIIVTDAEGNAEKYDLVMARRQSTHTDITRLTASGCEITSDEENRIYRVIADAAATKVELTVRISTSATAVLRDDIYGAEIKSTGSSTLKYVVDVSAGENIYNMTITAQDGVNVSVWKIIVSRPKNTGCELISIDDAIKGEGNLYTADINTAVFFVNAVSSTASTYHIYTNENCTDEIADPLLNLTEAQTVIWLQIHAEDENYKSIPYKVVINTTADLSKQEQGIHYAPMGDNGIIGVTGATEFDDNLIFVDLPDNVKEYFLKVVGKNGYQIYLFANPDKTVLINPEQVITLDSGMVCFYAKAIKGDDVQEYNIHVVSNRYNEYTDNLTDWAKPYIEELNNSGLGLIKGDENGRFNGEKNLTRYELATIMVRVCGLSSDQFARINVSFEDDIVDWAENYVKAAYKLGLVSGYPVYDESDAVIGYTFQGNKKATRGEFVVVLMRAYYGDIDAYYAENKQTIDHAVNSMGLNDLGLVPEWGKAAMYTAISNELVTGDDQKNVNFNSYMTRNEVATLFCRLLND